MEGSINESQAAESTSADGDGRLAGNKELHREGEVTRLGIGKGGGKGKCAAQPSPY